jgi:hypothetical protein
MTTNLHIYYKESIKHWADRIIKISVNASEGKI